MQLTVDRSNQAHETGWGLALHTVSRELGLAIGNHCGILRSQTWDLGRDLSSQFHTYLTRFIHPLTWQDFAFLAVVVGPGGFTGTRIGVVAARTLAQQLDLPLFGISTLAAIAWAVKSSDMSEFEGDLAVQLNAQRQEQFVAIYQAQRQGLQIQLPDQAMGVADWQQTLATWPRPYHLIDAPEPSAATVASALALAYSQWQQGDRPHWSEVLPFYGQHPVSQPVV